MFSSFYAFSTFFVAVVVLNLALMMFLGSKELSARMFAVAAFFDFLWLSSIGWAYLVTDPALSVLGARGTCFFGLVTVWMLFFCSLFYAEDLVFSRNIKILLFSGIFVALFLVYAKDILSLFGSPFDSWIKEQTIVSKTFPTNYGYVGWYFGTLMDVWTMLFYVISGCFVATLYQKYIHQTDPLLRKQTLFMFLSMVVGLSPAFLFNVMFPVMGNFKFFWLGGILSLGWVSVLGYSIIKQNQMNVRTVTAELLVVVLILIMFVGMFGV
jgi:hypothetical protein